MKKYILIISFLLCYIINFAQNFEPFTWQYPKYGAHTINCTRWITGQKFIAVGDAGAMLLSNDDGLTWQRIEPFTKQKFRNVYILSISTCIIIIKLQCVQLQSNKILYIHLDLIQMIFH